MADGTKINAATVTGGDTIDTEQVGSVKLPRSKVALGARDVDDGDVAAGNPMPVVVEGTPAVAVANFPATQPISAAALPLPAGAAQDDTLIGGAAKAQPVDASGNVLGTAGHPVRVDPVGTTPQPITAAALPLPAGAARASAQTDGTQQTQVTNFPATQPISAAALPLPAGAALASAQTDGTQKVQVVDAAGHHQPAGDAAARAIVVALSDAIGALLGTALAPLRTDPTGTTTQPISAAALPLPAGAAVAAAQTDGTQKTQVVDGAGHVQPAGDVPARAVSVALSDGALAVGTSGNPLHVQGVVTQAVSGEVTADIGATGGLALDATLTARLGTLGQKTSAASAPVVLASDQSAVPVTGAVTVSGPVSVVGAVTVVDSVDLGVVVHNFPATQPVSAASLPLPAGAAIASAQTDGTQKTQVTNFPATQPVSAAALPLPAGAATETTQATRLADATVTARLGTLGQKTSAGSAPVVLASDQSALPITVAALPIPTGAATETTLGTRVAAAQIPAALVGGRLDENVGAWLGSTAPTVGSKVSASSIPVVVASDQGAVPVSATSLTDGTQKAKVVDASGNVQPSADVAARALFAKITDGTNALPTMDVAARSAFQRVTDGTNTAAVKAASTAAAATDPSLVVALHPSSPVTQGTAAAVASAWPVKLTDGTNTAPAGDVAARAGFERITDGTNTAAVKAASTAAVATDSALVVAISPATPIVTMLGNAQQTPLSNATVTASSSATYTGVGHKEFNLVVNIKNAPTGTLPTLTFQIQELDPGDQTTAIGAAVVGVALIAAGTQTLKLADCTTGCVKVTWTIGGTATPSFTGVYATVSIKPTEDTIEQFAPVAEDNTNGVIAVTIKPLAVGVYAWAVGFSTALAASLIIKAAAGVLRSLRVRLDSTLGSGSFYLQLFNTTTLPADTTGTGSMLVAPVKVQFTTGTDQTITLDYTDAGIAFSTGLVVVLSSTEFTKTIAGAFLSMTALFK